jgi:S-adenosylmethionine:tRNA ribosyltransferase-isomerase
MTGSCLDRHAHKPPMNVADFDYHLPPELIAQTPAEPRDSARLMVVDRARGTITHRTFRDVGEYLRAGDVLVLNDTRVLPARLHAHKLPTGGRVELLLLRPLDAPERWEVLVRGHGLRPGTRLALDPPPGAPPVVGLDVHARVEQEYPTGERVVWFERAPDKWLGRLGEMPLPPYIHTPLADPERYQTVFARTPGAAAAPTAGLHFTPELLVGLREQGVRLDYVTLHIGLDTFRPVTEEHVEDHHIHSEWCRLAQETAEDLNRAKLAGGRVIAAGTTSVRVLETAGRGAFGRADGEACAWRPVSAFSGPTDLFIYPGYTFRVVDVLLTNFHLPRSTLLMLVSAFAGVELIRNAYAEAVAQRYRFFSFGDAMLLL